METGIPPVHLNRNMDFQERFDPQEANTFFSDNRAMRPPVHGTVARGGLREDFTYHYGRTERGDFVEHIPVTVTRDFLVRGRERYAIFCTLCHGAVGDGQGIVTTGGFGYVPAPSYHIDRLRLEPDGYFFDVITNGVRTMPGYGQLVPVADRWAIVSYIRALQRSQNATEEDVPPEVLAGLQQE